MFYLRTSRLKVVVYVEAYRGAVVGPAIETRLLQPLLLVVLFLILDLNSSSRPLRSWTNRDNHRYQILPKIDTLRIGYLKAFYFSSL